MAKKGEAKLINEDFAAIIYKWEFMRRNIAYQKDYDRWRKSKKEKDYNKIIEEYNFYPINYRKGAREYFKIFDSFLRGERKGFNWNNTDEKEICLFMTMAPADYKIASIDSYSKEEIPKVIGRKIKYRTYNFPNQGQLKYANTIRIVININKTKEELMQRIKEIIKECKEIKSENRLRLEDYRRYLSVYDLRKGGLTYEKLANKFYKGDVERGDLDYAKRKAKRDYDRCKDLIEDKYRQIR